MTGSPSLVRWKAGRASASAIAVLALAGGLLTVPLDEPALAWKPPTHLLAGETAMLDALDGKVTIVDVGGDPSKTVTVPANEVIVEALQKYPGSYRAGLVGPDAFPDSYFGQAAIHTETANSISDDWLTYLWERAWDPTLWISAPTPEAMTARRERWLKQIAFATGFLNHANGDMWAHTWVNSPAYASGVFPDIGEGPPPGGVWDDAAIAVRHVIIEGYVDKHRPGYDATQPVTYSFDAPIDFIANTLLISPFARSHGDHAFLDPFLERMDQVAHDAEELKFDNANQDCLDDAAATCTTVDHQGHKHFVCREEGCIPDPTDSPLNAVELGVDTATRAYYEAWLDDLVDGFDAWVELQQVVARELYSGKKANLAPISQAFDAWVLDHMLSMMGLPDFVGDGVLFSSQIAGAIAKFMSCAGSLMEEARRDSVFSAVYEGACDLFDALKADIENAALEIADDLLAAQFTESLHLDHLDADTFAVLDLNVDGTIQPSEMIEILREPENYVSDVRLFPSGTREKLDADMGLGPGSDDDTADIFRPYSLDNFAPVRNSYTLAQLSFLDEDGLNRFFRAKAAESGEAAGLKDLYPKHNNTTGDWYVPNNIMLGWMKSLDGDHQWREQSLYEFEDQPSEGKCEPGGTTLVSKNDAGQVGNGRSDLSTFPTSAHGSISSDNRYVVFQSAATTLVPNDTNGLRDIFVHDCLTGTTTSVTAGADGVSHNPAMSADGRYVVFDSPAKNLKDKSPPGRLTDVFVHDRDSGTTTMVSTSRTPRCGLNSRLSRVAAISANGGSIAFESDAWDYVSGDTNGKIDIFVIDRNTIPDPPTKETSCEETLGPFERVSVSSDGGEANNHSFNASLSADGRYVAFQSAASNLAPNDTNGKVDVFVHDRVTKTTSLVSADTNGGASNGVSTLPSLSADGRYVAFESTATDLVTEDDNGAIRDVFVRDMATGTTEVVNLTTDGTQGTNEAIQPSISADGRYVAFAASSKLVLGDTDGVRDIYVRDRAADATIHASLRSDGTNEIAGADTPAISADGTMVAFNSLASDLDADVTDTNGAYDVFVRVEDQPLDGNMPGNGRIAFVNTKDGNSEIYTMNPDGSDQIRLTNNFATDSHPKWSHDGRRIAFASTRSPAGIYVMNEDGSDLRLVAAATGAHRPSWSPDDTQIAYVASAGGSLPQQIFIANADGSGTPTQLTGGPGEIVCIDHEGKAHIDCQQGQQFLPEWSPDGSEIVFVSNRATGGEIWVVNVPTGDRQREIVDIGEGASWPTWSPDSRTIAYDSGLGGSRNIWFVDRDGSNKRQITNDPETYAAFRFSPDGTKIVTQRQGGRLWIMNIDGTGLTQIPPPPNGEHRTPDWQPVFATEDDASGGGTELGPGRSHGTGEMWLWEDCVARSVFRSIFFEPVAGHLAFTDDFDSPTNRTDDEGPTLSLSTGSPKAVANGKTFVTSATQFDLSASDNYFPVSGMEMKVRTFEGGASTPPYSSVSNPHSLTLTGSDGAHRIEADAIADPCSNEGNLLSETFYVDNTPPSVSIAEPSAEKYDSSDHIVLQFSVTDTGSGVGSQKATLDGAAVANGDMIDMFFLYPGDHVVEVTATDRVGNQDVGSKSFVVRATAESLQENVDKAFALGLITKPGVYQGLIDKLEAAEASHLRGQHKTEHKQLKAFINHLKAQSGKAIDTELADRLIAYATDLIANEFA